MKTFYRYERYPDITASNSGRVVKYVSLPADFIDV